MPWRRRLLLGCSSLVLITISACGGWFWWESQRGWTVAQLERSIRAEIPPLCERPTVDAWLDRHHIYHVWVEDTTSARRGDQTMPELVGLRSADLSGMSEGILEAREANVDWLFGGRISIYFFFNKQGRLAGHLVEPFIYFP